MWSKPRLGGHRQGFVLFEFDVWERKITVGAKMPQRSPGIPGGRPPPSVALKRKLASPRNSGEARAPSRFILTVLVLLS